jgi:hypothetical protein
MKTASATAADVDVDHDTAYIGWIIHLSGVVQSPLAHKEIDPTRDHESRFARPLTAKFERQDPKLRKQREWKGMER